jgi:hypothetical protein
VNTAGTHNWRLKLEPNWEAEESKECLTISRVGGAGALQISAAVKDAGEVEPHEIQEFARQDPTVRDLHPRRLGVFSGFATEYVSDQQYWLKCFAAHGRLLLFVTYTCEAGDIDQERDTVNRMLGTLVAITS